MIPQLYGFKLLSLLLSLPSRYPPLAAPASLPIQPQRGGAIAIIKREVRGVVLHIRLPGARDTHTIQVYIVLLLCRIALDVKDNLLTRLQVLRAHFLLEYCRELGVVDVAAVARLIWHVHAIQRAMRFPDNREGAHGQAFELARERRRHICAVLLDLQLRLNADVFEIALGQLEGIDEVAAIATGDVEL